MPYFKGKYLYKAITIALRNTLLNSKHVVYINQKTSSTINSPLGKEVKMGTRKRRSEGKFTITDTRFMEHHHGPADMDRCWSDIQYAPMRELSEAVREALAPYDIGKTEVLPDENSPYLSPDDPDFEKITGLNMVVPTPANMGLHRQPRSVEVHDPNSGWCHED